MDEIEAFDPIGVAYGDEELTNGDGTFIFDEDTGASPGGPGSLGGPGNP